MGDRAVVLDPVVDKVAGTPRRRAEVWSWQHYLAVVGAVFLAWQSWTLVAWLQKGPRASTAFRDESAGAWTAARAYEAVAVLMAVTVLAYVVRRCRRERRLVFDAMLCIGGASAFWLDPVANFFQPVYVISSNWTNVGSWCSQVPFIVNDDCGRVPEPIVFMGLLYLTGFVVTGAAMGVVIRWARRRMPNLTTPRLIMGICALSVVVDLLVEYPAIYLHLWNYPSNSNAIALFGHNVKYPFVLAVGAIIGWGSVAVLRNFTNDRGETVIERGMERFSPRRRTIVSVLCVVAYMNLMVLTVDLVLALGGPYSSEWRGLPAYVVNGACDTADGVASDTRYGPCPGSPGYRFPGRSDLDPTRKPPGG